MLRSAFLNSSKFHSGGWEQPGPAVPSGQSATGPGHLVAKSVVLELLSSVAVLCDGVH